MCTDQCNEQNGRLRVIGSVEEALEHGINWYVFRKPMFIKHPLLPKWVQAADNAKGQVLCAYLYTCYDYIVLFTFTRLLIDYR